MKIKTLLVCFLAVALSLTSCKKENYAEKFSGSYNGTLTPELTISAPELGTEEVIEGETIEPFLFSISQVGETQDVNVIIPLSGLLYEDWEDLNEYGVQLPENLVLSGTCDETGLHINGLTLNQTVTLDEYFGYVVGINMTLGGATIPDWSSMLWTSPLNGTITITVPPMMEGMEEMTFEGTISGNLKINAEKILFE